MALQATAPTAFSDDGSRAIQQEIRLSTIGARDPAFSLEIYYELSRTVDFIAGRGLTRIALQFPDDLLPESPEVLWKLQVGERVRLLLFVNTFVSIQSELRRR